jgi:PAS domain S-box-containing protein
MVASQMSSGVIITDHDGRVEWANEAFTRMTGYGSDELVGARPRDVLHGPDSDPATVAVILSAMASREPFNVELLAYHRNGRTLWVEIEANPLLGADGEPEGFMVMTSDISERKRVERMKSELVSTVSHELRTPLTAISGALGLVASGVTGALPEKAQGMITIAERNSKRLTRLIDDLLDMEKLVGGKVRLDMEVRDLMPLVERAITENQSYADHYGVRFVLQSSVPGVQVDVDVLRLKQVLTNLLSNAAKFSRAESVVELRLAAGPSVVRIEVVDSGCGIPGSFHDRVFEKFSRADSSDTRSTGGTGLGLAISKELVERMGGLIGFASIEGFGSTFYFELPIATLNEE